MTKSIQGNFKPLEFDNIAAMRLVFGKREGQPAKVLGYTDPGDGGGGPDRTWTEGAAPGTYVDNGGSIIVPTGGDGSAAWLWVGVSEVDIRWYGAKGDGVTDNTASIMSAFSNHRSLTASDGIYNFTNLDVAFDEAIYFTGSSRKDTILNCTSTSGIGFRLIGTNRAVLEMFTLKGNQADVGFQIDSNAGANYPFMFALSDVEIIGLTETNSTALRISDSSHIQVQNVNLQAAGTGMLFDATGFNTGVAAFNNVFFNDKNGDYGVDIKGNVVDSISFTGCYFGGSIVAEVVGDGTFNTNGIAHIACHYENDTSLAGNSLVKIAGGSGIGGKGLSWISCTFGGFGVCENAFSIDAGYHYGISITNSFFQNIKSTGYIIADDAGAVFKDCLIQSMFLVTTSPNLFLTNNFRDDGGWLGGWIILNDGVADFQKGFSLTGIKAYTDEAAASTASLIDGRIYKDNLGRLRIKGAYTSTQIALLPDSANPSVSGGEKFRYQGATTITDFTGGVTEQIIYILGESSFTVTHGTNIFLNGAVNFGMTNRDTLTLIQKNDGNWYELSRSVN